MSHTDPLDESLRALAGLMVRQYPLSHIVRAIGAAVEDDLARPAEPGFTRARFDGRGEQVFDGGD